MQNPSNYISIFSCKDIGSQSQPLKLLVKSEAAHKLYSKRPGKQAAAMPQYFYKMTDTGSSLLKWKFF